MIALWLIALATESAPLPQKPIAEPRDVIALEAGTWDAVITIPPKSASGKPATAIGVQVNEIRSGGLWMLNRMSVNGGAYQGTGIWGFEPRTGRYSGTWADNGSQSLRKDEGVWDASTNTMTWTSEILRPDGRVVRMKATSNFSGRVRLYRSFAVTDAGDVPLSTVVFTRRLQGE